MDAGGAGPEYSVAMWGAPSSGKTTFLAALDIALTRLDQSWKVIGADKVSSDELTKLNTEITRRNAFPRATQGISHYHWVLVGNVQRSIRVPRAIFKRWFRTVQHQVSVMINLDFTDMRGGLLRTEPIGVQADVIDNLARSRGIVFLFDPISEAKDGDAFHTTDGVLRSLAQRMLGTPEFADGKLPHYVAVCVTKFDEIRVLRSAERLGMLVRDFSDERNFPRVDDADARDFFASLCKVSQSQYADLVLNKLEQFFAADRIKFFVSSAIGFYLDPARGSYDPADYQNMLPDESQPPDVNGQKPLRIRGVIHPINVVEPMLWLASKLTKSPEISTSR